MPVSVAGPILKHYLKMKPKDPGARIMRAAHRRLLEEAASSLPPQRDEDAVALEDLGSAGGAQPGTLRRWCETPSALANTPLILYLRTLGILSLTESERTRLEGAIEAEYIVNVLLREPRKACALFANIVPPNARRVLYHLLSITEDEETLLIKPDLDREEDFVEIEFRNENSAAAAAESARTTLWTQLQSIDKILDATDKLTITVGGIRLFRASVALAHRQIQLVLGHIADAATQREEILAQLESAFDKMYTRDKSDEHYCQWRDLAIVLAERGEMAR